MSLSRMLFKLAARTLDVEVLVSGSPRRIVRHAARKTVGRYFWRGLRQVLR